MPWLMMRRHALRLRHLWLYLEKDGEQVWSPFVRHAFPELISWTELQSWVKKRPRRGEWHRECRVALQQLCRPGSHLTGCNTTKAFYRGLVEGRYDDDLGANLGVDEDYLTRLFQTTFGPGPMDNHQRSLAWQCYRGALPVRDKLYRHGSRNTEPTCPRCRLNDETVLHALVQCPAICDLWAYVEQLLSRLGRIDLSTESIVNIVAPPSLQKEGKAVFLTLVAMAKECVWWSRLKGLQTNTFLSDQPLINFFKYHLKRKIRVEREVLSNECFVKRWVKVARMVRMNDGTTLNMIL